MTPETAVDTALAKASPIAARVAVAPTVAPSAADTAHAIVAVVGLGYVGLPTAIAMRNAGCRIVGIDVSARRLEAIRDGEAELLESEQDDLRGHLAAGDGFSLTGKIEA